MVQFKDGLLDHTNLAKTLLYASCIADPERVMAVKTTTSRQMRQPSLCDAWMHAHVMVLADHAENTEHHERVTHLFNRQLHTCAPPSCIRAHVFAQHGMLKAR